MITKKIAENIHLIAFNDRRTELFENLWKIPDGVSMNCYLLLGEKNILIDTAGAEYTEQLICQVNKMTEGKGLDALIVLHAEPDHSSAVMPILRAFPDCKMYCNKSSKMILGNLYNAEPEVELLTDGLELELGEHKFVYATIPSVHWPDSSVIYHANNKILFSNDAFGSFGAIDGGVFDDETDYLRREDDLMRYYTNIVGKFGKQTQKAIAKLADIDIDIIAPSHGILWRSHTDYVLSKYQKWNRNEGCKGAVVLYGSMYGNTAEMADQAAMGLADAGIKDIRVYDISSTFKGRVLNEVFRYEGVILAAPVYYGSIYPPMKEIVNLIVEYGVKDRKVALLGNYCWGPAPLKKLDQAVEDLNWQLIGEKLQVSGAMDDEQSDRSYELGKMLGQALLED
jgi:flavorubredoxin